MGKDIKITSGGGSYFKGLGKIEGQLLAGDKEAGFGPSKSGGPADPKDKPTKEKKAADAKIAANPEFDVDAPLPEGSSDIGGEMVGYAPKAVVGTSSPTGFSRIGSGGNNQQVYTRSDASSQGRGGQTLNLSGDMTTNNNVPTSGKYSGDQKPGSSGYRSQTIDQIVNTNPVIGRQILADAQKAAGESTITSPSGKKVKRSDMAINNPQSTHTKASILSDLKVQQEKPVVKFKASGAPKLYGKVKK